MDKRTTIKKAERLSSKRVIHQLFKNGRSFYIRPFKVFYHYHPGPEKSPVQVLITVSKKHIKKASKRNEVKRKVREAYRLNKHLLADVSTENGSSLAIALIYTESTIPESKDIREKIIRVLERLNTEILQ
jgi:ribonuclease P protein component